VVVAFPLLAEAQAMLASVTASFPALQELAREEVVSPKVPVLEVVVLAILVDGVVLASAPMAYQEREVEWGHRQGQL
jgi:hypothetical protein